MQLSPARSRPSQVSSSYRHWTGLQRRAWPQPHPQVCVHEIGLRVTRPSPQTGGGRGRTLTSRVSLLGSQACRSCAAAGRASPRARRVTRSSRARVVTAGISESAYVALRAFASHRESLSARGGYETRAACSSAFGPTLIERPEIRDARSRYRCRPPASGPGPCRRRRCRPGAHFASVSEG